MKHWRSKLKKKTMQNYVVNDVNTKFRICILVFCRLQLEVYAGKRTMHMLLLNNYN